MTTFTTQLQDLFDNDFNKLLGLIHHIMQNYSKVRIDNEFKAPYEWLKHEKYQDYIEIDFNCTSDSIPNGDFNKEERKELMEVDKFFTIDIVLAITNERGSIEGLKFIE